MKAREQRGLEQMQQLSRRAREQMRQKGRQRKQVREKMEHVMDQRRASEERCCWQVPSPCRSTPSPAA
jgi:hypothetical protein